MAHRCAVGKKNTRGKRNERARMLMAMTSKESNKEPDLQYLQRERECVCVLYIKSLGKECTV